MAVNTGNVFISFFGMQSADVAAVLRSLGNHCTSAAHQLRTNKNCFPFIDGGTVRCLFLSEAGFSALGSLADMPNDPAFGAGMEAAGLRIADPPRRSWNAVGWRGAPPDAMFMVADADEATVTKISSKSKPGWTEPVSKFWWWRAGCKTLKAEDVLFRTHLLEDEPALGTLSPGRFA